MGQWQNTFHSEHVILLALPLYYMYFIFCIFHYTKDLVFLRFMRFPRFPRFTFFSHFSHFLRFMRTLISPASHFAREAKYEQFDISLIYSPSSLCSFLSLVLFSFTSSLYPLSLLYPYNALKFSYIAFTTCLTKILLLRPLILSN